MDTVICDITALKYWRIPPVVQLLAAAPTADERLAKLLTPYDLEVLSANCVSAQDKLKQKHYARAGEVYRTLLDEAPLLALCGDIPFNLLIGHRGEVRESKLVKPCLWTAPLPPAATKPATEQIGVTSPEFTLLQLAAHSSFEQTLLLATEFCGCFSVFHAPDPIAKIIQRLCDSGRLPNMGGWSPCLDAGGKLTDLWSREPLTTPDALLRTAQASDSPRGRKRLARVAKLVVPGAASPFEAQAGILLGLPTRCGGAGLGGFSHNHRVGLTPDAAYVAHRNACYCDLYWDEGVDLECHSKTWHTQTKDQLSDFTRQAALELMGIEVIPMTYEQLTTTRQFDTIARLVAAKLDRQLRKKNDAERAAELKLRREVLDFDWN